MTQRQIARLACKLLAIYAIIDALKYVEYAAYGFTSMSQYFEYNASFFVAAAIAISIAVPIIQIGAGIWLWRKAGVVAAMITGHSLQDEENEPDAMPKGAALEQVHAVALSIVGVWILVDSIPQILSWMVTLLMSASLAANSTESEVASRSVSWDFVWLFARLSLGMWLLFGAPRLVRMLKSFIYVGLDDSERPPQSKQPQMNADDER